MATKSAQHPWQFRARFRRNAFGWRSDPAIKRVREAVSEIAQVARKDPILGAEGAVLFLERVSPALEHVDGSSGAIGREVRHAVETLAGIVAAAPADRSTREAWLERLFEASQEDQMPWIENLADHWGEFCASSELASEWADRLIGITRMALAPCQTGRGHFHGTSACLSALHTAGRYEELIDLVRDEKVGFYTRWVGMALLAQGKKAEAVEFAERSRNPWSGGWDIDRFCEGVLLSDSLVEEAYRRYGLHANRAGTYLAWFRAVSKKYPHKKPSEILEDLVNVTPGEEGKWFAAAKDAKLFDEAIALANRTPCSPQTLTRAARDFQQKNPSFAVEAGLAALRWLVEGYGYEVTGTDVLNAYAYTMKAAENAGCAEMTRRRVEQLTSGKAARASFAGDLLRRELGLP